MIYEYITKLGVLEKKLINTLKNITTKKDMEDIINHYIQAKFEIIDTYADIGVPTVYTELINYVKAYLTLLTGESL